ncbi:kinase-like protein [Lepidopterella palustris CBS 459.81]|uniref:Kinase-like protein n=1 Tax=Lepidopterella palustris CBS 459.81 TaxID=1314670 RepID=A0A8E2JC94_9PEZI|nr:kinase-like protein [Lepidopterella palustris CBS 459.81]
MKINQTSQTLSLVLHALETTVAPDLTNPTALGALELIKPALNDLLKRQGPSVPLLRKCIEEGEALYHEIQKHLDGAAAGPKRPYSTVGNFDTLATQYDELTEKIDALCNRLTAIESNNPSALALIRRAAEWELSYYTTLQQIHARPFGDEPGTSSDDSAAPPLTKEFFENFLIKARGHALEVTKFTANPGSFGKQTYFATVKHADGFIEDLVIRKCDPAPIMLHSSFLLDQEFDLLKAVSATGYPAPKPLDLALNLPGVDGTFFTMSKISGKLPGSFLEGHQAKIGEDIWLQLAERLAQLHSIPMSNFEELIKKYDEEGAIDDTVQSRYHRNLRGWRDYVTRIEHLPSPFITYLFSWLERNVPEDGRKPVLTHGDFNIHNVLFEDGKLTGVLDWECSDFGAPEQDLAYIQPHVSRHMEWQKFVDHYKASGGQEIDMRFMPFTLAYSVLRTMLGGVRATRNLQVGHNRDLRYIMVELGFAPAFMQMGLACTSAQKEGGAIDETSKQETKVEEMAAKGNGNVDLEATLDADVNGTNKANGANGHRYVADRYRAPADMRAKVSGAGVKTLQIYGDEVNVRQKPGPQANWQNSVVLVWWDDKNAVGGFHRIGHEPNLEGGGMVVLWDYVLSPKGMYKRMHHIPLRDADLLPNGGFGSGDDTCKCEISNGEHIWTIDDGDVSGRITCADTGPNVDCYPKKGQINDFTSHHFDIPGIVYGWLKVKGEEYKVDGLGVRDAGWGPRNWGTVYSHRWIAGTCGKSLSIIAVSWHGIDESIAAFGWVVRNGVITYAKKVKILAYVEEDASTNHGGNVTFTLTTGEVLVVECTPVPVKAMVSYHQNVCVVDRMCTMTCGGLRGMCNFETSANIQMGSRRPTKFSNGIIDNGFFEDARPV